ncbi:hypothetical protein HanHA300_Chr10g0365151 [Helianthus annuus]|nr:hypothetical protein HanHA300_Chr10g0365151 [Helianthus annuus]KAJ0530183.1 hypothetical protein HanHA89_Chr10g0386751 [Helianthus annuus]KAJ0697054.1 hypothetical protein HanLR1_Chr10g0364411 [Helianthus annuus]
MPWKIPEDGTGRKLISVTSSVLVPNPTTTLLPTTQHLQTVKYKVSPHTVLGDQ